LLVFVSVTVNGYEPAGTLPGTVTFKDEPWKGLDPDEVKLAGEKEEVTPVGKPETEYEPEKLPLVWRAAVIANDTESAVPP
jgi:hypothetical protein